MHLSDLGDIYLKKFFLLGQSSYDPYSDDIIKSKIKTVFPAVCYSICILVLTCFAIYGLSETVLTFKNAIYGLFILTMFMTCTLVLQKSPIFGNNSKILWMYFLNVEQLCMQKLQMTMSFTHFNQSYIRKLWKSIGMFLVVLVIKFIFRINKINKVREVATLLLVFSTYITNFHILFYVSLLAYMIKLLNRNTVQLYYDTIRHVNNENERDKILTVAFKNYKQIHFKLWEISQLIGDQFGLILVSLFLQNINNTVQPIYRTIVLFYKDDIPHNMRILSKLF